MGKSVHIIFIGKGNSITNCVSVEQFEKIYKPKGWVIDDSYEAPEVDPNFLNLKSEQEIKNYNKMKQTVEYYFDDGLFKKED